jgi:hypothetical protein
LYVDTELVGAEIASFIERYPENCEAACADNSMCMKFTHHQSDDGPRCRLLAGGTSTRIAWPGAVSGLCSEILPTEAQPLGLSAVQMSSIVITETGTSQVQYLGSLSVSDSSTPLTITGINAASLAGGFTLTADVKVNSAFFQKATKRSDRPTPALRIQVGSALQTLPIPGSVADGFRVQATHTIDIAQSAVFDAW